MQRGLLAGQTTSCCKSWSFGCLASHWPAPLCIPRPLSPVATVPRISFLTVFRLLCTSVHPPSLVPQCHAPLRLSLSNASATVVAFATDDNHSINAHPQDWCGQWLVGGGAKLEGSAACPGRGRAPTASTTFRTATPTFPTAAPTCPSAAPTFHTAVTGSRRCMLWDVCVSTLRRR